MMIRGHFVLATILCLFLMQALIPSGYMPSFDKDGKIAIVICSLEGDETIYVDADQVPFSGEKNHPPSDHSQSTCPYAVLTTSSILESSAQTVSEASTLSDIYYQFQAVSLWSDLSYTPYHSRAPPVPYPLI
jgi:hypothetical protein